MLQRIAHALWGKFEGRAELQKFGFLALIFFSIIGTFWALKPLKESIFATTVGVDYLPLVKILSVFFIIPMIMIYSKLIDRFERQNVFYILIVGYGLLALVFTVFFLHPSYGLANKIENPTRIIGWLWYVYVDSFVSVMVALFWAITTDITLPEPARRGFPFIFMFGQLGNIAGPLFLRAKRFGFATSAPIAAICGFIMFGIGLLMWFFMRVTPKEQLQGYKPESSLPSVKDGPVMAKKEKKQLGFLEGARLLFSNWYLLGIFLIIMIYEAIVVVFDYHMHVMSRAAFPQEIANAEYLAQLGVWTGIVAWLCVIFGINSIQRVLGIRASLVLTPLLVAVAAITLKFYPYLSVVFWIMVFAKAVNYALNQPTIKQLYIPTSKEARYKVQGWIDMFGARGAKSIGSAFNMFRVLFKTKYGAIAGVNIFLTLSTTLSMGLIVGWLFMVFYIARTYDRAISKKELVC